MSTTQRREFLQNAVLGTAVLTAAATVHSAAAQEAVPKKRKVLGINTSHRAGKTCAAALQIVLDSVKASDTTLETEFIELAPLNFGIPVVGSTQPKDDLDIILSKIDTPECVALVLATPVYFGLPSARCISLIDRFMPLKRGEKLKNKIFGGVAVGAGRNGGQETLLHALTDSMLTLQMIIANDSVPSSHWGATLWNQNDSIEQDEIGKGTAKNLGHRIAELVKLLG
jgi:multimeric flavodoxin WrbA